MLIKYLKKHFVAFSELRWWDEAPTQHHGSWYARSEHVSLQLICKCILTQVFQL